ncbi:hypothetical protein IAR55_006343 [Kwoniella newhampshirensis]|uniref:HbrB-domain-containing protein n=1 Tax=Kwoniella newhampshirensis TaxID=1651941 RepID=A0AAW0YFP2_9TREE
MTTQPPLNTSSAYLTYSPRRAPLPPSPTYSTTSFTSTNTRGSSGLGTGGGDLAPPPLPAKNDKRLPLPPSVGSGGSPHRSGSGTGGVGKHAGGWAVGVYDNKLVSSTLSHLPPLPPLSPTPSSSSHPLHPTSSSSQLRTSASSSPRPSISKPHAHSHSSGPLPSSSSNGVVVFQDGTPLSDHHHTLTHSHSSLGHNLSHGHNHGHGHDPIGVRAAESMTVAHSSPSSPWSLLTVHVLPLFAGGALKTPVEDLNHLCHSHIVATSQRAPPSRIVALLSSDLREFIGSGMLTLKAKFDTLEEGKVVSRAAEVWSFFWTQVLPYVEGVFLPFTQLRDIPTNTTSSNISSSTSSYLSTIHSPIPVRHLLLSGFLLHILVPLLPRLIPQITSPSTSTMTSPSTSQELARILQMALVLSTQARYSSFFPSTSTVISSERDEEIRGNVDSLGKAVRWKTQQSEKAETKPESPVKSPLGSGGTAPATGGRTNLQRGSSGRYRRRGWRASSYMGFGLGPQGQPHGPVPGPQSETMSRQNSGDPNAISSRWGRPRVEEEDEDDEDDEDLTPNSTLVPPQGQGQGGPRRSRTDTVDSTLNNHTTGMSITPSMMSVRTAASASTAMMSMGSTLTSGTTIRGESLASYGETPTPTTSHGGLGVQMGTGTMYGRPVGRRTRTESEGSGDVTSVGGDRRGDRRI